MSAPEDNPFESPKGTEESPVRNRNLPLDTPSEPIPAPIVAVWFINLLQVFLLALSGGPHAGFFCVMSAMSILIASLLLIPRRPVWMVGFGYFLVQFLVLLLIPLVRMLGPYGNPLAMIPAAMVGAVLWNLMRPESRAYYWGRNGRELPPF